MIDEYVRDLMRSKLIPDLSIGVVKDDVILLAKGYGMANLEHSVAATESTVYEVASVGKTFTAMVVMMLVEEGSIALDDAIADYLPIPAALQSVKIRHILSIASVASS